MTDYSIEKSSEIFFGIAKCYVKKAITDHDEIMSSLADLDRQLGQLVILDFLDMSNLGYADDVKIRDVKMRHQKHTLVTNAMLSSEITGWQASRALS